MDQRRRKQVRYKDPSSGESDPYADIRDIADIPSDTSSWNREHLVALRIRYRNANNADEIIRPADLDDKYKTLLLDTWDKKKFTDPGDIRTLDKSVASLIMKIRYVLNLGMWAAKKEVRVDGFVMTLLNFLGFDQYPCTMYSQYTYKAKFKDNKKIASKVDFIVTNLDKYVLLVVEDKHQGNTGAFNDWSESQLAGEIFGCAYHTVQMSEFYPNVVLSFPITVRAIRIIGTLFTFYKTEVTKAYIEESYHKLPVRNQINVTRYPEMPEASEDTLASITGLDFCDPSDRLEILRILKAIRDHADGPF